MDLITSLLKLQGFSLNFINTKKIICLFLISSIMNIYIRCIPDFKIYFGFGMARIDP